MEQKFCPYPGLRPFNEEESIFFKGRDTQVSKVVSLLEKNKFLMITGASGDGKSSLTYAGLIPNARAGFFKAKFNNWRIADFRPERTPLENLVYSLSKALQIPKQEIEQAVKAGFSSLVNLYKNSKWHVDYLSDEWLLADENAKKAIKRKGANVLILVDQFEEFFTNQENFTNGIPSVESQLVMNVLLETAKIAHSQDLPIYVVCTMRSDYIGQCAAFRGLPEMIGFSQFFVPRLKRKEIQQVITEPAKLAGCQITTRLSETLINELGSGFDQLPVLQHALNQLWQLSYGANGNGKEMDLLSLAKLGGISTQTLNEEEKKEFEHWESKISTYKKKYLENPSLENVLNAHADELYENAADYYNASQATKISDDTAKQVIKIAFQCLVKTDEGRTVRSRMTLREITKIINIPSIDEDTVAEILEIFRLQGNTFLKPYKDEQDKLERNSVLDITHESLIRNWARLKEWAKEEYEDFQTYLDFNKQLQRWLANNKSSGYLLPIGPLTYFENWYNTCEPNANWLVRYDDREIEHQQKFVDAEENLKQAQHFIKKSANKLFFTRTVLKYGANKLLAIAAIFVLICSCTYFYFDYRKKQNENVVLEIEENSIELLKNKKIKPKEKADFLITYERLHPGSFSKVLTDLNSDTTAFDIALEMFILCQNIDDIDGAKVNPFVYTLVDYLEATLDKIYSKRKKVNGDNFYIRFENFIRLCFFVKSNQNDHKIINELINKNAIRLFQDYVKRKINCPIDSLAVDAVVFNSALEIILTNTNNSITNEILEKLSPFQGKESLLRFQKVFSKEKLYKADYNDKNITHNGGYLMLSYYYGAKGNFSKTEMCLDSIIKYNPNFSSFYRNNFYDIASHILVNLKKENVMDFEKIITKYEKYSGVKKINILQDLIYRTKDLYQIYQIKSAGQIMSNYYEYSSGSILAASDFYVSEMKICSKNENERLLKLALFYKWKGFDKNISEEKSFQYFKEAFYIYAKLPMNFLKEDYVIGNAGTSDSKKIKNSVLFLYPMMINFNNYWRPFFVKNESYNFRFLNFLMRENYMQKFYTTNEDWVCYNNFLENYYTSNKLIEWMLKGKFNYDYFSFSERLINENSFTKSNLDSNFIFLVLANKYFEEKDTNKAYHYVKKLNLKKCKTDEFQKKGNWNTDALSKLAENLALNNSEPQKAMDLINSFADNYIKRNVLIDIISKIANTKLSENTFFYYNELAKLIEKDQKYGLKFFKMSGIIGGNSIYNIAKVYLKECRDENKPRAFLLFINGICSNGNYFKAKSFIPEFVSPSTELKLNTEILKSEVQSRIKNNKKSLGTEFFKKYDTFLNFREIVQDNEKPDGQGLFFSDN